MNDLKIKKQWLMTLLERLGVKPKSDGVVRDMQNLEKKETTQNEQNESRRSETQEPDSVGKALLQKNERIPIMPTLTKPCEDPSPVEGQRSVNEQAYDYDVRRLI